MDHHRITSKSERERTICLIIFILLALLALAALLLLGQGKDGTHPSLLRGIGMALPGVFFS